LLDLINFFDLFKVFSMSVESVKNENFVSLSAFLIKIRMYGGLKGFF
jgi:hypothetical protein